MNEEYKANKKIKKTETELWKKDEKFIICPMKGRIYSG